MFSWCYVGVLHLSPPVSSAVTNRPHLAMKLLSVNYLIPAEQKERLCITEAATRAHGP